MDGGGDSIEQGQQFGWLVDHGAGTVGEQFLTITETPGGTDGEKTGADRGLHVRVGIADVKPLVRRDPELAADR